MLALLRASPTLVGGRDADDPALEHALRLQNDAARARLRAEAALRAQAADAARSRPILQIAAHGPGPRTSGSDRALDDGPVRLSATAGRAQPEPRAWETRSPPAPELGPTPAWNGPAGRARPIRRADPPPPRPARSVRGTSNTEDEVPRPRRLSFERLLTDFAAGPPAPSTPARIEPWDFEMPAAPATTARRSRESRPRRKSGGRSINTLLGRRRSPGRLRRTVRVRGVLLVIVAAVAAWSVASRAGEPGVQGKLVPAAASTAPSSPTAYARAEIPASYMKLYLRAAANYDLNWAILAAVGQVESLQGRSLFPGVRAGTNAAGAAGPAQFLSATWDRYGVDGDGDGKINPYDPADAIPSMASYLRASGAPENWRKALFAYNHSNSYVAAVLAMSRRFD